MPLPNDLRAGAVASLLSIAALGAALPAHADDSGPRALSFADAVKRALAQNPTARVADQEIRRAYALMEEARAASLPTVIGTGTYTRLDNDRKFNGNTIAAKDQLSANVTLSMPLLHPKVWAQWSHAKDNVDVARASAADVRRALAIAVGRAYLAVVAEHVLLVSAVHARDTAKKHYDFAHQRYAGGVGNRIDEVRAAQALATDESHVSNAELALARAEEALGVLVGIDGAVDATSEAFGGDVPSLASALTEAEKRRTDVALTQKRIEAADRVVRDDWTDLSPYLVGNFQPFYQNPASFTVPQTGWQATLVLTLPFYDGGLRYGQWHERQALASEARANLEGIVRQAKSDVRAAYESVRRADEALAAARDAAKLAKEALDLATIAYGAGATTNLEVIDAQSRWRDAESDAATAEDTARNARLDLLAASGRFP